MNQCSPSNTLALLFDDDLFRQPHLLSQDIAAIELAPGLTGEPRLEPVSKIPAGAELASCGPGLDSWTVKISWRGKYYFVFRQDLESQSTLPPVLP